MTEQLNTAEKRAVILLSGGLDSATVVAMARADGYSCYTMSFDYGQRHRAELQAAERVARQLGVVEHKVIGLNLNGIGGSALTDSSIAVPEALGACATDLQAGFGGFQGRALQAGDCLPLGAPHPLSGQRGCRSPDWTPLLRALPGPDYASFSPSAQAAFWQRQWTVTPQSNRMGMRLRGTPLLRRQPIELLSHAVLPGVVQVPPDGQPIVLMADAQTTGGYPCIASVIQADQWKLAQARPGARLRFVPCTTSEARQALRQQVQAGLRLQRMLAQG